MTVTEWAKEPGVSDLRSNVKVKFIKALILEEQGNHSEAQSYLEQAVEQDEKNKAS